MSYSAYKATFAILYKFININQLVYINNLDYLAVLLLSLLVKEQDMVRHYYVTDDLDDLEHVEYELERKGII